MSFQLYPAIDMRNGKCVRLLQGDYAKETIYGDSPFDMAMQFANNGATWIHMVDLDGARDGKRVNDGFVIQAANDLQANIQIGGGIRTEQDIVHYLDQGIARVILGSVAIENPVFAKEMLRKYGNQLAIGLDAKDGFVATHGWVTTSSVKAIDVAKEFAEAGTETFIFTDIATDGMLSGPNEQAVVELAHATGKNVIASGGVSGLHDLHSLQKRQEDGVVGVIVGKALYEEKFTLAQALSEVQS
ncbi:1-(5-phosphoribosyl)-5-[(5-phosphoribosylamino)methylideneamino]imidazole-4-carboxamide isomerase [Paenisporosarcina cavernae]|uniref:1-(5-phosphoribosyl)-5-[(5- phosphoribosylamino)methylideneamino]imidazole-4- carboxamide isomerase n=1 Tax=Paenisporosarcina cavernae TaxID=2320858 RepID=UPI001EE577D2|nr:1-(5-phosphoribosyl)-5-[(5-phosphoribosylamino)methylideneamino]imidazole-4-carboxamide isomerase [Paenisporosarcina cavernae]